jgi:hypothetical protein
MKRYGIGIGEKDGNRNWRGGNGLEKDGIGTGEKEMDWREGRE